METQKKKKTRCRTLTPRFRRKKKLNKLVSERNFAFPQLIHMITIAEKRDS